MKFVILRNFLVSHIIILLLYENTTAQSKHIRYNDINNNRFKNINNEDNIEDVSQIYNTNNSNQDVDNSNIDNDDNNNNKLDDDNYNKDVEEENNEMFKNEVKFKNSLKQNSLPSQEALFNNFINYIKTTSKKISNNKPKYIKLIVPKYSYSNSTSSNSNDKLDYNINKKKSVFVEHFDYNDFKEKIKGLSRKIINIEDNSINNYKQQITPIEGKIIDLSTKNKVFESKTKQTTKELERIKANLQEIIQKTELIKAESKSKSDYYQTYVKDVMKELSKLDNSTQKLGQTPISHKNFNEYSKKFDILYDTFKDFLYLDSKDLALRQEIEDFVEIINLSSKASNSNAENKALSKKTVVNNILKSNQNNNYNLLPLDINGELDIKQLNTAKIRDLFLNNTSIEVINDIKEFFEKRSKNFTKNFVSPVENNVNKLKLKLDSLRKTHKERLNKIKDLMSNSKSLNNLNSNYKKIVNEQQNESLGLGNKIKTLTKSIELRKKEQIYRENKITPYIEKLEVKLLNSNESDKKEKDVKLKIDHAENMIDELIRQENLLFKTNKINFK